MAEVEDEVVTIPRSTAPGSVVPPALNSLIVGGTARIRGGKAARACGEETKKHKKRTALVQPDAAESKGVDRRCRELGAHVASIPICACARASAGCKAIENKQAGWEVD